MAQNITPPFPSFAEQQAIIARAEKLRAEAVADMFRAVAHAFGRLFAGLRNKQLASH